jgi:hypothetical protein
MGWGFGIADYPIALLLAILSPFIALDILGLILGGQLLGTRLLVALFKAPWREIGQILKGLRPVLIEIYKMFSVLTWLHKIDRLIGGNRR